MPPPLIDRLAPGGRLVQPIGPGGSEKVTLFVKRGRKLETVRVVTLAFFVPLIGAYGFDEGFIPAEHSCGVFRGNRTNDDPSETRP